VKKNQNQQRYKNDNHSSSASSNLNDEKKQINSISDISHANSDQKSGSWVLLVFIILIVGIILLGWLTK
jgi:uncharacterized ion transporter superfamily protein YfcC